MTTDFLILYVREDGAFARLSTAGVPRDAERRMPVTEETLCDVLHALVGELVGERELPARSVTAAYVLAGRIEVLSDALREAMASFRFVDSLTQLSREEVFFVAASVHAETVPGAVLFCDSRETRLFSSEGEYDLPRADTGGNGFLDFLLSFTEREGDSLAYLVAQIPRLCELFSVYKAFGVRDGADTSRETVLFPDPEAHSGLSVRVAAPRSDETVPIAEIEAHAECDAVIRYYALSDGDRAKVDRKYPALYRSVRDRRGNYLQVSMKDCANAFRAMLRPIEDASVTALTVVGQYARFPLLHDYLRSFAAFPVRVERESLLVLRGMERLLLDSIADSRLSVVGLDGREIVLWDASLDESFPEKRISFPVTLRTELSAEDVRKGIAVLPYRLRMTTLRKTEDGSFLYERIERTGDLRDLCYEPRRDGSYRIALGSADPKETFTTALLGIGATPDGVTAHLSPL